MRQMWEQFRFEPEEYIPVGQDKVVVPWLITAVGRDGVETTAHAATVFTVRSGKLAHAKAFQSKADARRGCGPWLAPARAADRVEPLLERPLLPVLGQLEEALALGLRRHQLLR